MFKYFKKNKLILLVFLVALVFRLFIFGSLITNYGPGSFYLDNDGQSFIGHDVQYYILIPRNLIEHGVYSSFLDPPFQPTSYRTPLMPFYLLPFIYFFGFNGVWLAILILNIILSLTAVLVYYLAKLFLSEKKSLAIGFLVALEPLLALYSNLVEADAIFILFFLASLYYLILFWQGQSDKKLYFSALFLGVATLAKPVGIYLLILFIIFILLKLFFEKFKPKKLIIQLLIFGVIFLAIISPWLLRNYLTFGVWGLSSIKAQNLYSYYTDHIKLENEVIDIPSEVRDPLRSLTYQNQFVGIALDRIKAHPVAYFKNHLLGTLRSFYASDLQSFYYHGFTKLLPFEYNPVNDFDLSQAVLSGNFEGVFKYIFSPSGFGYIWRYLILSLFYLVIIFAWFKVFKKDKKTFIIFSLFLVLTLYFLLTPGHYVDPKYRLPVIPLLLIVFFYNFEKTKIVSKSDNKKIVIAAEIFPPDIGGPATYSKKLADELSKREWQVKVICYSTKIENDNHLPVTRILRGQSTLKRYWQYFWHLRKLANKDCDLIYAQGPVSSGLPAVIVGFLLGKKVVVKVVGDYAWEQARNLGQTEIGINEFQKQNPAGKIGWLKKIEKFVCQKASKVIVPSEYLKSIVKGWGVREDKIEVIYNAITPGFTPEIKTVKGEIISVGRLVSWKGFETLIRLMPELLNENPDFKLRIYGSGPEEEKLQELIEDLNLEKKVVIKQVDHDQLMLKLANGEMFVLNTGYEGLPHTVLEAISVGLPVVTTNVCGNPEIIQDNYSGLLVEYNSKEQLKQAILKLDNNPELGQKFVANSKEVLKKFSFEEMINKTINILELTNK